MFRLFARLKSVCRNKGKLLDKVIISDTGYHGHIIGSALRRHGIGLVAYINEEPWSHKTEMLGAKLHYPSELVALCEKNGVTAIICLEGQGWMPESHTLNSLKQLGVELIVVDATLKPEQASEYAMTQLKKG